MAGGVEAIGARLAKIGTDIGKLKTNRTASHMQNGKDQKMNSNIGRLQLPQIP